MSAAFPGASSATTGSALLPSRAETKRQIRERDDPGVPSAFRSRGPTSSTPPAAGSETLDGPPERAVKSASLFLAGRLERVPEIVGRDLTTEHDSGHAGEVVVQAGPQAGGGDPATERIWQVGGGGAGEGC